MSRADAFEKTIKIGDDWTIPNENGVGRRVLVEGAVWTIPVIAAAVATPAAAASQPLCPTVPPASAWALAETQGNIQTGTGAPTRDGAQGSEWFDFIEPQPDTGNASVKFYTNITVAPGQILDFSFYAAASRGVGGNQSPTAAIYSFQILASTGLTSLISSTSQDGSTPYSPANNPFTVYTQRAATYTVPAGVTEIQLQMDFRHNGTVQNQVSDELGVTAPTVTCR